MTRTTPLRILADENLAAVQEAFAPLGALRTFAARALTRDMLADVDVLLVRSTTRVNADLLEGTPVRFVGSATAGVDHVDVDWLASRGIVFAAAPGCNAPAVADYVTAALLELAENRHFVLSGRTLGVVGVGHVGARVAARGEALGMRVLRNDPPLAEATGQAQFRPIDEVAAQSDVITLHVPLTRDGRWPTWRMVNAEWLGRLRAGAMLINTSRGDVADEAAVCKALTGRRLGAAAWDVWSGEPMIDARLAALSAIATPHIAGYSREARLSGTAALHARLCAWRGRPESWRPPRESDWVVNPPRAVCDEACIRSVVRQALDLRDITHALRRALADRTLPQFDALRREQETRREFSGVVVNGIASESLLAKLARLRFRVEGAT